MEPIERDAAPRQPVDLRRRQGRVAVAAEVIGALLIRHNE
jgi:hypothetical protein